MSLLTGVYAIVNEGSGDCAAVARAVLEAGIRIVQYRAKNGIVPEHARAIRRLTRKSGALFVLNDRWEAVEPYEADGVHLGPDDISLEELPRLRAALSDRIVGVSCGNAQEAQLAQRAGADYVGVGCVFATKSKSDAGAPIGLDGLRAVSQSTVLPVAAIGGISVANIARVRACGVAMAAVISAIGDAADPHAAALALVRAWETS